MNENSEASAFNSILKWSERRPQWQRDALRRLIESNRLTSSDIDELFSICKAEHFTNSKAQTTVSPLMINHIPSQDENPRTSKILELKEVENVNLLDRSSILTLAHKGLTVVYGDNGSGKSSYAKILKQICRARGRNSPLLPSAFSTSSGAASAKVVYETDDGTRTTFCWSEKITSPNELSQISFFDSESASVYIDKTTDPAFTPLGLDLLPKLVEICEAIQVKLKDEREAVRKKRSRTIAGFDSSNESQVSKLVKTINFDSNISDFKSLALLAASEKERMLELKNILVQDSSTELNRLNAEKNRLEKLLHIFQKIDSVLSDSEIDNIKQLVDDFKSKQKAAELIQKDTFIEEKLEGIATPTWHILWEAARQYSIQYAYPSKAYPNVESGSLCVLCQQEIGQDASSRLEKFESFVKNTTEKLMANASLKIVEVSERLSQLPLKTKQHQDTLSNLEFERPEIWKLSRRYLVLSQIRRRSILTAIKTGEWNNIPKTSEIFDGELTKIIESIQVKMDTLQKAGDPQERLRLTAELLELQHRDWLNSNLDEITDEIACLKELDAYDKALKDAGTGPITKMSSELADKFITSTLCDAFSSELKNLGLGRIKLELVPKNGEGGSKNYQLKLLGKINPVLDKTPLSSILSQGEQRCVALAAFLSELSISAHNYGLIIDDPVSSLDHTFKDAIARRLVKESQKRQVIVLTHDLTFLLELQDNAKRLDVPFNSYQLRRSGDKAGIPLGTLPWQALGVSKRISYLKDRLQKLEKLERGDSFEETEDLTKTIYLRLRETYERGVEELLLNGAVIRFGKGVETQRLKKISDITDTDVKTIDQEMRYCSNYVHDEATANYAPLPMAETVKNDIERCERWIESLRKRR